MSLDSHNMLETLRQFPVQCRKALDLPRGMAAKKNVSSIVIAGMGGSAIGGDLLKSYLSDINIPIFVVRDYKMPSFVDKYSLVFPVSYSGNTEETLSAFRDAKSKGAQIFSVTSGGKLGAESEKWIKIPSGMQPRAALGYLFFPILGILHNTGIANVKNNELNEMLALIKSSKEIEEGADALAKKLKDKIPIIYSSNEMAPVAMRWKTQFNENAKMPCFFNTFSEMNHNEIEGLRGMDRKFAAVILKSQHDSERVRKRMNITRDLMQERIDVEEVKVKGDSLLARLVYSAYLGDFVSYFLAIRNRVDPTPVEVIEALKKKLV